MAFPTLDRLGVSNFSGTQPANTTVEFANFKKDYTVDIIKRFDEKTVFANSVMKRQINSGTGAEFPLTGKTDGKYFIPGVTADLGGDQGLPQTNKTINVDRLLLSDILVANMDDLMAHVDVRAERSKQQADALVRKNDSHLAQLLILCARATSIVSGAPTGGTLSVANADTDVDVLVKLVKDSVEKLASNDVPIDLGDITSVFRPTQYFLLLESNKVVDADYQGSGTRTGKVPTLYGSTIDWSNRVPNSDLSTAENGDLNGYNGDFSLTQGVTYHRSAVGTVQLLDLNFEYEWLIQKQANLFVAKMAVGHGYLRPEASVEMAKTGS